MSGSCDRSDQAHAENGAPHPGRPSAARSRAVELLVRLLVSGDATPDDIAEALMVPVTIISAYRNGRRAMPLERQLLLAAFAIERTPRHARHAHRLRGQVGAAIAFAMRDMSTRPLPPPPHW